MGKQKRRWSLVVGASLLSTGASAQIPDLLNAFDAGGRSTGAGGSLHAVTADTLSSYNNPAGLGYLDRREVGISYRNLPKSSSVVGNNYNDPIRSTTGESGKSTITHVGFAVPLSAIFRRATGTLAFSYTLGGYIDEAGALAPNAALPVASGLSLKNYTDRIYSKSDFYTIAIGKTNPAGNLAYGVGVVLLNQHTTFTQTGTYVDANGQPINPQFSLPDLSGSSFGVGLLAGLMYSPLSNPNISFGLSYRTPISLSGSETTDVYKRVPGRIIASAALRTGSLRKGKDDFAIYGVEYQQYFGGSGISVFDRDSQTILGVGFEYNLALNRARLPIRLGVRNVTSGGAGYRGRSSFDYGLGYYPESGPFGVDLNYSRPRTGGSDMSISATYRFK